MYARVLHRAAVGRIYRRRPANLSQRFLASVEPASATDGANPPPSVFSESTTNLESWTSVVGTSPSSVPSFQVPADDSLKESSETLLSRDHHTTQRSTTPTTASSSICVVPELRALHIPGILSLVRELEQRFGRIREFRTLRDKDSPGDFLKALFVTFYHEDSVEKIRSTLRGRRTGTITVGPPPEWNRSRQVAGGVGLEDIQALLRPGNAELQPAETGIENGLVEEAVSPVEKTLESAERNVDDLGGDRSEQVSPASSMDTCECHIEILTDNFQNSPLFNDKDRVRTSTQQQAHISRSLVHWAGFYPHYRFASFSEEKSTDNYDKLSDAGEHRTDTVHLATRDLREMIIRHRTRLYSLGQADHGISYRGTRPIVLDWELDPQLGMQGAPVADPAQAESPVRHVREANVKMAKTVSPKENENSEHTPTHSYDLCAQLNEKPIPKSTIAAKGPSKVIPSSLSSARSNVRGASASSTPSLPSSRPNPPEDTASTESMTRNDVAAAGVSEMRNAENNRARRSRKKAEQERAGFKAKLLGWLGR